MGVAERINSKDEGDYGANVTSVGVVADAENVPSSMVCLMLSFVVVVVDGRCCRKQGC